MQTLEILARNVNRIIASDWSNTIFIEHRINSNIIFQTSNELERVHLLAIELEHHIFGFERSNIEL